VTADIEYEDSEASHVDVFNVDDCGSGRTPVGEILADDRPYLFSSVQPDPDQCNPVTPTSDLNDSGITTIFGFFDPANCHPDGQQTGSSPLSPTNLSETDKSKDPQGIDVNRSASPRSDFEAPKSLGEEPICHPWCGYQQYTPDYFLNFHQSHISRSHYFLNSDFSQICTNSLFTMARKSAGLRYAMAAFSALIYTIKVDPSSLESAFFYYQMAVRQFRESVKSTGRESGLATALVLAAFEVLPLAIAKLILAILGR